MKKKNFAINFSLKKVKHSYLFIFVLISLITIFSYYVLIKNSFVDETMLYSWNWIVNYLDVKMFFSLLIVIFFISYFIAKVDFKIKDNYFLIFIFITAFFLSSLFWSAPDPNPDVAEFFGVAKYIKINGLFDYFKSFGTDDLRKYRFHSLHPFLGLAFQLFGESPLVIHIIMSSLYAFIPVLTFFLAKKLFSRKIAFISSFLVIAMPNMVVQSSMFLVDVPTVFFVLLALLSFHFFLHDRKIISYFLTVFTLLFAMTSKRPASLFLILSLFVLFLIAKRHNGFKLKSFGLRSFVVFYIVFVVLFSFVFLKMDFFSEQLLLDLSQANIIGNPPHYVNPFSYFFQIQPLTVFLFLIFLVLFAFKPKLSNLFLIAWIFFPYIFIHDTTVRYMLPAFPAIAIAAAIVLSKFKKQIIVFSVSVIVLSSILSLVLGYIPLLKNEFYDNNIKLAADYVDSLDVETVGVYMHYKDVIYKTSPKTEIYGYVFDYYSSKRVYYDVSESVRAVYNNGFERFNIFDYYKDEKDENYFHPSHDAVVVFSNVLDWENINYSDVKALKKTIEKDYFLERTFSIGKSGIEENKFGFVYVEIN